jgi:GrpB-like predicted nucleotidyltransferase (UPF0157 family)
MTLKEKFRQNLTGHLSDEKTEVDVRIAEKIADEFAIGFADWLNKDKETKNRLKELLEIYKKEMGLCEKK